MTRWARPGHNDSSARNRKVSAATPWDELQQRKAGAGQSKRGAPSEDSVPQKKRRNEADGSQDVDGFRARQGDVDWKNQRRDNRRVKRQENKRNKMVCFHCRKPGHGMADCAEALKHQEMGSGICFRCGSTEHEISKCRAKVDPALGEFPYAKCFICGEMGHLSRSCPDNPKGLYAVGGGCRKCGSVEHFQRDCPEQQTSAQITVGRWSNEMSADHEDVPVTPKVRKMPTKTPKVVSF